MAQHIRVRGHCLKWDRKTLKSQKNRVCCEMVSPRKVKNYTHEAEPTWLPKHDTDKNNTNRHLNWGKCMGALILVGKS